MKYKVKVSILAILAIVSLVAGFNLLKRGMISESNQRQSTVNYVEDNYEKLANDDAPELKEVIKVESSHLDNYSSKATIIGTDDVGYELFMKDEIVAEKVRGKFDEGRHLISIGFVSFAITLLSIMWISIIMDRKESEKKASSEETSDVQSL